MVTARLRLPFFLLALLAIAAVVLIERGAVGASQVASAWLPGLKQGSQAIQQGLQVFRPEQSAELSKMLSKIELEKDTGQAPLPSRVRGVAIPAMQYVDGCLLFTMLLMGLALLVPPNVQAKIQGVITLVFAIVLITAGIVLIIKVIVELILMVVLLLSFPFGTIAYLLIYGHFPRSAMSAVLGLLFMLKILFGVLLLLAHEGFLKNIGLVIFIAVSFVAGLVVSFLYGLVPGILVSITDAIAAIVVTIIGIILGIILLIGSIPSIITMLKSLAPQKIAPL